MVGSVGHTGNSMQCSYKDLSYRQIFFVFLINYVIIIIHYLFFNIVTVVSGKFLVDGVVANTDCQRARLSGEDGGVKMVG